MWKPQIDVNAWLKISLCQSTSIITVYFGKTSQQRLNIVDTRAVVLSRMFFVAKWLFLHN
jgi:hypothetical protein